MTEGTHEPEELEQYPAWREALKRWPQSGFTWGDVIPHEWFYEQFNLPLVRPDMTVKEAEKIEFKRLSQFEPFRRALLEEYRMHLVSVRGYGYEIVTPVEQTRRAFDDMIQSIKKAIRDGVRCIRYVAINQLTDAQRRENADLLARAAMLARVYKPITIPSETDSDD